MLEHRFVMKWVGKGEDRREEKIPVLDRKGEPAMDREGNPRFQQTVIVRRTDVKGLSL